MSNLNLYLIRGFNHTRGVNEKSYQELCNTKILESDDDFMIYQYFVAARSQDECREIFIPYIPISNEIQKRIFFKKITCVEVCKYNELDTDWPHKNNKGNEYIYKSELEKIGYNESKYTYAAKNKLSFRDISEYLSGFPQVVCIDFMLKFNNKDNITTVHNDILYFPINFNKISFNLEEKVPFVSWIRKPLNQLSRNIYNKYPDKALQNWYSGVITPNCDITHKYCREKCCYHYLSEFYPDNIDVSLMSELIYILKTLE